MAIGQLTFEAFRWALANDSGLTTAANSSTTTTGTASAGSAELTVAATTSFSVGHGVKVDNAGTGGGPLATWITAINGSVFTLKDKVITQVTSQAVSHDDRGVVIANNIIPATGNLPAAFPAIVIRMSGAEGFDFSNSMSGELSLFVYTQSEPRSSGQPMTILNLICDRIKSLLHRQEEGISNAAIRVQALREDFRNGVIPEIDVSETTHSQALRYEYIVNLA